MPSERRLHPTSVIFNVFSQVRRYALPAAFWLLSGGLTGIGAYASVTTIALLFGVGSVVRYISFRYRYEDSEMVVRTGLIFRNERHVPYARIQNLAATQNLFHRLFGVVTASVDTGGGDEPEATMSVLPIADYEEMRRRVFEGRERSAIEPAEGAPRADGVPVATTERVLLQLSPRDLMVHGLIANRGIIIIAGAWGLLWEMGLMDGIMNRFLGDDAARAGMFREVVRAMFGREAMPLSRIALGVGALLAVLLVVWLLSPLWALVRLHGFKLVRAGDDLRSEYGLLSHVIATVPAHRIQTVTIRTTPLHRYFARTSVRVETAGGSGGEGDGARGQQRDWLAPIIRRDELPAFLDELLPDLDFESIEWRPHHPGAFRREVKRWLFTATLLTLPFVWFLRWWTPVLLVGFLLAAVVGAHRAVRNLGWAVESGVVLFRSGWLWRHVTAAPVTKIQAATVRETPFDRRRGMAQVRVDTAGAGSLSHRIYIPYLARETAADLARNLAARAARTAFRW